jgi:hypothetical protein
MADQFKLTIGDSLKKIGQSLENLAPTVESAINEAISDVAINAYVTIMAKANQKLHSTRADYLKGLQFEDLGDNSYLISLDGEWATALEDGFPSFNMTEGLLGSPKAHTAKDGHKFMHVPIERKVSAPGGSNMADAIKGLTAQNAAGRKQKITSLFKDDSGNPMTGKVATAKSDNPLLNGLTKYQQVVQTDKGSKVRSIYINYRTISENGKPWIHPGFGGIHAFEEAEREVVAQLDNIIKDLL